MKGKMAIIGDGDSTLIFKAAGIDSYSANSLSEFKQTLKNIKDNYQIIFVTDVFAKDSQEFISEINNDVYPIILTVPGKNGNNGYGIECLKKEMERSLGVDILFNNDW